MNQEPVEVEVTAEDPILPATSRRHSTLIVFFDVQCGPCQEFSAKLYTEVLPRVRGRLRVDFKHFPICTDCNSYASNQHPQACQFARMLEAARIQGGMNAFRKVALLLEPLHGPAGDEYLRMVCREADLDYHRFRASTNSDRVERLVQHHVRSGQRLAIDGTPYLVLDDRPLDLRIAQIPQFWNIVREKASTVDVSIRTAGESAD